MKDIASYIDHTNLRPTATEEDICRLCDEAREHGFASVCVMPSYVGVARARLAGCGVRVCTVIGFPLGQTTTAAKCFEVEEAYRAGCDEFDMVINVGRLKAGDTAAVEGEIAAVVAAAHGRVVKVILETCLLDDGEKALATRLACRAGAHFVKTSTGFGSGGATAADVRLMKESCSGGCRVKASGGIRTYADARALIDAGADRLGTSAGVAILGESRGK